MTPNPFLAPYSSEEINNLTISGSLMPRYDDNENLLIDGSQTVMASSSITIPLFAMLFNDSKVETKYAVTFTELT
jgi:hypothetical protein